MRLSRPTGNVTPALPPATTAMLPASLPVIVISLPIAPVVEAGEVMAAVQTAMLALLPYPKLRDAILAHPTMSEGLGDLFANVPPRSGP
jgi:hypothetical protein